MQGNWHSVSHTISLPQNHDRINKHNQVNSFYSSSVSTQLPSPLPLYVSSLSSASTSFSSSSLTCSPSPFYAGYSGRSRSFSTTHECSLPLTKRRTPCSIQEMAGPHTRFDPCDDRAFLASINMLPDEADQQFDEIASNIDRDNSTAAILASQMSLISQSSRGDGVPASPAATSRLPSTCSIASSSVSAGYQWTLRDDLLLLRLVSVHGNSWTMIADALSQRVQQHLAVNRQQKNLSASACTRRWQKINEVLLLSAALDPNTSMSFDDDNEDESEDNEAENEAFSTSTQISIRKVLKQHLYTKINRCHETGKKLLTFSKNTQPSPAASSVSPPAAPSTTGKGKYARSTKLTNKMLVRALSASELQSEQKKCKVPKMDPRALVHRHGQFDGDANHDPDAPVHAESLASSFALDSTHQFRSSASTSTLPPIAPPKRDPPTAAVSQQQLFRRTANAKALATAYVNSGVVIDSQTPGCRRVWTACPPPPETLSTLTGSPIVVKKYDTYDFLRRQAAAGEQKLNTRSEHSLAHVSTSCHSTDVRTSENQSDCRSQVIQNLCSGHPVSLAALSVAGLKLGNQQHQKHPQQKALKWNPSPCRLLGENYFSQASSPSRQQRSASVAQEGIMRRQQQQDDTLSQCGSDHSSVVQSELQHLHYPEGHCIMDNFDNGGWGMTGIPATVSLSDIALDHGVNIACGGSGRMIEGGCPSTTWSTASQAASSVDFASPISTNESRLKNNEWCDQTVPISRLPDSSCGSSATFGGQQPHVTLPLEVMSSGRGAESDQYARRSETPVGPDDGDRLVARGMEWMRDNLGIVLEEEVSVHNQIPACSQPRSDTWVPPTPILESEMECHDTVDQHQLSSSLAPDHCSNQGKNGLAGSRAAKRMRQDDTNADGGTMSDAHSINIHQHPQQLSYQHGVASWSSVVENEFSIATSISAAASPILFQKLLSSVVGPCCDILLQSVHAPNMEKENQQNSLPHSGFNTITLSSAKRNGSATGSTTPTTSSRINSSRTFPLPPSPGQSQHSVVTRLLLEPAKHVLNFFSILPPSTREQHFFNYSSIASSSFSCADELQCPTGGSESRLDSYISPPYPLISSVSSSLPPSSWSGNLFPAQRWCNEWWCSENNGNGHGIVVDEISNHSTTALGHKQQWKTVYQKVDDAVVTCGHFWKRAIDYIFPKRKWAYERMMLPLPSSSMESPSQEFLIRRCRLPLNASDHTFENVGDDAEIVLMPKHSFNHLRPTSTRYQLRPDDMHERMVHSSMLPPESGPYCSALSSLKMALRERCDECQPGHPYWTLYHSSAPARGSLCNDYMNCFNNCQRYFKIASEHDRFIRSKRECSVAAHNRNGTQQPLHGRNHHHHFELERVKYLNYMDDIAPDSDYYSDQPCRDDLGSTSVIAQYTRALKNLRSTFGSHTGDHIQRGASFINSLHAILQMVDQGCSQAGCDNNTLQGLLMLSNHSLD